jgi:F0F1-type ATP synthase assembly protein I
MNGLRPNIPRELLRYAVLGVEFAVIVTVCVYAGILLDKRLGTRPAFILIGMVLGFAGGMYRFVRVALDYQRKLRQPKGPGDKAGGGDE